MHLLVRRFSSIEGKGYEYNNPDESREIKLNGPNDESTSSKTMKGKTSDENKRGGRKSGNQTTRPIAQHVSSLYKRSGESIRLQLRQCCNDYTIHLQISKDKAYIFFLQLQTCTCNCNCDYANKLYNQDNEIPINLERSASKVIILMLMIWGRSHIT